MMVDVGSQKEKSNMGVWANICLRVKFLWMIIKPNWLNMKLKNVKF